MVDEGMGCRDQLVRGRLGPYDLSPLSDIGRRDGREGNSPSTRRLRVADGSVMVDPCIALVTLTWHPSRELFQPISSVGIHKWVGRGDVRVRQSERHVEHVLRINQRQYHSDVARG
jgi:hypothetical protein